MAIEARLYTAQTQRRRSRKKDHSKMKLRLPTECEHEQNLVCAEHRVDCLQSKILGGVRDGFLCSTNQHSQFRLRHHVHYVTALIQTNKTIIMKFNAGISCSICGHRNLLKKICLTFISVLFAAINI